MRRMVRRVRFEGWDVVADVLYAVLLIGGFAVLGLCLRGLERL